MRLGLWPIVEPEHRLDNRRKIGWHVDGTSAPAVGAACVRILLERHAKRGAHGGDGAGEHDRATEHAGIDHI